jgi:hypothetical protein
LHDSEENVVLSAKSTLSFLSGAVLSAAIFFSFVNSRKSEKYVFASCFVGEESLPLFELDGKTYDVGGLPPDLHLAYLQSKVDDYRRIGELADHFAARVASSPSGQPNPVKEFLKANWVKDEDIDTYLKSNSNSFSGAVQPDTLREAVRQHLEQQKISSFINQKKYQLIQEKRIRNLFPMPCGPESKTSVDGVSYVLNGTSGPVPVRAFLDLSSQQSRFILTQFKTLSETAKEQTTIREIFIPSDRDGISETLARGAHCSFKQGQKHYVKYRTAVGDLVVPESERRKRMSKFSDSPILEELIQRVDGLNRKIFDECLKSEEAQKQIDASLMAAQKDGIALAPAVFLNRRRVLFIGNQSPAEVLKELAFAILQK